MTHFLIYNSDGDTVVKEINPEKFLKEVADGDHGEPKFFEALPSEGNTNYWGGKSLIISGEVVFPKPKRVVKEYEF